MLSAVRPSLRPSQGCIIQKTVEVRRIMKLSPHGSPIPLVFAEYVFAEILRGSPRAGKIRNGHISATVHPIHFMFGSRVGYRFFEDG